MRGLDRGKRREPRLPATAGSSALSCAWRGERGKRKYPVLKSSFAYCASRRRVFGSANNGGLPLSTSLSSFSLSLSLRPLPPFRFRGAHVCSITRMPPGALLPSDDFSKRARARNRRDPAIPGERESRSIILDHARRASFPDHPGRSLGHSRDFHSSRHRGQTPRPLPLL